MEESKQQSLEDFAAKRLVNKVEGMSNNNVPEKGETTLDRGGEIGEHVQPEIALSNVPMSVSGETDHVSTDAAGELTRTSPTAVTDKFAKVEKSLISLGFFTPSSSRIKNQKIKRISFTRTVDGKKVEASVEFIPSAMFGLPITADQDKFLALHHIITRQMQTRGQISNPIRFTSAELLRLLNKRVRAGKNYKDISEWLDVMMTTTIFSNGVVYDAGKKQYAKDRFHVFERAVSVGKEMPDGTIADANYVWLSPWQIENINQKFLLPIDLDTYGQLKNHIAKALVPLLQVWLFAAHGKGRDRVEKRYDELCQMLSVQEYKAPSLITRQLKPSLDELVKHEYLKEAYIEKTADRKSYKVVFLHGPKFHRDLRRRIDQKNVTEESIIIARSEPELPEPGRLESTMPPVRAGKRAVVPAVDQAKVPADGEVSERDTLIDALSGRGMVPSVVVKLLDALPAEKLATVQDYIDYWDTIPSDKRHQGFLYTLIKEGKGLPSSFETSRQRQKRLAAQQHRLDLEAIKLQLEDAYRQHRETIITRFIEQELGQEEFERRVITVKKDMPSQGGIWNRPDVIDGAARHQVRVRIAEEMGTMRFMPLQEFKKRELPAILAKLGLNLAAFPELGIERPSGQ